MIRLWKGILLVLALVFLLTSCGQSIEDRAAQGMQVAEEAFVAQKKKTTEKIDDIQIYKPTGYTVSEDSDAQNIVLYKGKDTFILFVNPNEGKDSSLFYDLLQADENKEIIKEETFLEEGAFGFAAVVQGENGYVELIASAGGAKMTTLTKEKRTANYLKDMMTVVRSVD